MTHLDRSRIARVAVALSLSTALHACAVEGDDVYERQPLPEAGGSGGEAPPGGSGGAGGAVDPGPPLWADVEPIVTAKCAICHSATPTGGAPMSLADYASAFPNAERMVARSGARTMPPAGLPTLTDAEIDLIAEWFAGGALESAGLPEHPTWTHIEPIIVSRCGSCHGAPTSGGAPFSLITYEGASMYAERSAIRTEVGTMPPLGLGKTPCTPAEVKALRAWADDGAPK